MRKTKTTSPKKGNVAEMSCRTSLEIEFHKQNLLQDIKNWNEQLPGLEFSIDKIEKTSKKELTLKSQELNKEFLHAQAKIKKLNHDIEAIQKRFNKDRVKFETKLLEPFSKGEFKHQSQTILEEAKVNIAKIQAGFDSSKELLNPIVGKCLQYTKRLAAIEDNIHKICLPDEMEEATKINEKLNDRMKAICTETATFSDRANAEPYDSKPITNTVLQLYKSHCEGKKLLEQIQKNLHIVQPPEMLEVKDNNAPALK